MSEFIIKEDGGNVILEECVSIETEITIPDNVTIIGEYAFSACKKLMKIEIPSSVRIIEKDAFCDCINLLEVIIPDSNWN